MYKIGISTCGGKAINQESFLAMKAAGIDAAEICLADYSATDFKRSEPTRMPRESSFSLYIHTLTQALTSHHSTRRVISAQWGNFVG